MVFFCVDIGTTTLKAAAITETGSVVFFTKRILSTFAQSSCCDASHLWKLAFISCVVEYNALSLNGNHKSVAPDCIIFSGNGPTLVSVDKNGTVLKTFLWNMPSDYLSSKEGHSAFSGCHSIYIPRIAAFMHDNKSLYDESRFLISGPEYMVFFLTGVIGTSLPEKRYLPAYWDANSCKQYAVDSNRLAPFFDAGTCAGYVTKEAALLTGFMSGTPVLWGLPDFLAAIAGTGAVFPGVVCDRAGTSEGVNVCVSSVPTVTNDSLRVLPSIIPDLWNVSYLIPDSGARVLTESLVADLQKGIALLRSATGYQISQLRMCGGQSAHSEWLKVKAEKLGVTIVVPQCSDSELMGSAVLASVYHGVYSNVQNAVSSMVQGLC